VVHDHWQLIGQIDAAIIATPTEHHYQVATDLLNHSIHTLIEKPLTNSPKLARELVATAERNCCVVQVGHVERFNPAIALALENIGQPKFVQACRTSGFTFRSTDIGVVHDLMIHDIDLVNSMFGGTLVDTRAVGLSILGSHEDLAHARLQFSCGGVANLTASRCSFQSQRTLQVFGTAGFAAVDLSTLEVTLVRAPGWLQRRELDFQDLGPDQPSFVRQYLFSEILPNQTLSPKPDNAILEEQKDWLSAITTGTSPRVTAEQACQAIEIAQAILRCIDSHVWFDQSQPSSADRPTIGPLASPQNSWAELEPVPVSLQATRPRRAA
jgi:predicted dehydrogenase